MYLPLVRLLLEIILNRCFRSNTKCHIYNKWQTSKRCSNQWPNLIVPSAVWFLCLRQFAILIKRREFQSKEPINWKRMPTVARIEIKFEWNLWPATSITIWQLTIHDKCQVQISSNFKLPFWINKSIYMKMTKWWKDKYTWNFILCDTFFVHQIANYSSALWNQKNPMATSALAAVSVKYLIWTITKFHHNKMSNNGKSLNHAFEIRQNQSKSNGNDIHIFLWS